MEKQFGQTNQQAPRFQSSLPKKGHKIHRESQRTDGPSPHRGPSPETGTLRSSKGVVTKDRMNGLEITPM